MAIKNVELKKMAELFIDKHSWRRGAHGAWYDAHSKRSRCWWYCLSWGRNCMDNISPCTDVHWIIKNIHSENMNSSLESPLNILMVLFYLKKSSNGLLKVRVHLRAEHRMDYPDWNSTGHLRLRVVRLALCVTLHNNRITVILLWDPSLMMPLFITSSIWKA